MLFSITLFLFNILHIIIRIVFCTPTSNILYQKQWQIYERGSMESASPPRYQYNVIFYIIYGA